MSTPSTTESLVNNLFMLAYPALYLVGIGIAIKNWSRYPTAAFLCVSGLGVMLARSAMWIIPTMIQSEWLTNTLTLPNLVGRIVSIAAIGLVIVAVFADRDSSRRAEGNACDLEFDD